MPCKNDWEISVLLMCLQPSLGKRYLESGQVGVLCSHCQDPYRCFLPGRWQGILRRSLAEKTFPVERTKAQRPSAEARVWYTLEKLKCANGWCEHSMQDGEASHEAGEGSRGLEGLRAVLMKAVEPAEGLTIKEPDRMSVSEGSSRSSWRKDCTGARKPPQRPSQ